MSPPILDPIRGALLRSQPDARLVALVREGRERAFEEIVRRYRAPLVGFAAMIVPPDRADDVVQESLLAAYSSLQTSAAEIALRPWLFRIVRNRALNDLRDTPVAEALTEEHDGVAQPAEIAERNEQIAALLGGLRALPDAQREAIVARELEGRGHAEIAAELGTSTGAVRQLIFRARGALRDAAGLLVPLPLLRFLLGPGGAETGVTAAAGAGAGVAAASGGAAATGIGAKVAVGLAGVAIAVGGGIAVDRGHDEGDGGAGTDQPDGGQALAAGDGGDGSSGGPSGGSASHDGSAGSSTGGSGGDDRSGGGSGSGKREGGENEGGHGGGSSGPGSGGGDADDDFDDDLDDFEGDDSSGSGSSGSGSSGSGESGSGSSGSGSSGSGSASSGSGSGGSEFEPPEIEDPEPDDSGSGGSGSGAADSDSELDDSESG